ncbi:hypothetical protein DL93DRAFT_2098595 [Clavulina sp. PMI_390]|nr:hypothetical protein DL93DRAFT_2098595 [Clavulina sp. PMI_390]
MSFGGLSPKLSSSTNTKLQRATATIDEITKGLSDFASTSSELEPFNVDVPVCSCCDNETCTTKKAWQQDRSKLVDRLVLSAGELRVWMMVPPNISVQLTTKRVRFFLRQTPGLSLLEIGQALLERHEAYIAEQSASHSIAHDRITSLERSNDQALSRLSELIRAADNSEKRLAQTRLNLDVAEASNRTLLREVQEDRTQLSRMAGQVARAVGLEEKLEAVRLERDDVVQERDAAEGRTKALEGKVSSLTNKCASLESEVKRLLDQLDAHARRSPERELSEELLRDARARLDMLQHSPESSEVNTLLESLVADNEALKRDNAELRNFLGEARTEIRSLSDEVQELRANATMSPTHPALRRADTNGFRSPSQPNSPPPQNFGFSRNTSPRMLLATLDDPEGRFVREPSPGAQSSVTVESSNAEAPSESGPDADSSQIQVSPPRPKRQRTLMLLSRSKGVQTDPEEPEDFLSALPSSHNPIRRPGGGHSQRPSFSDLPSITDHTSETSSLSGTAISTSMTAPLPEMIERLNALLTRLNQTTVESLTARLKRQNLLAGSDIGHLSHSSIAHIQADVAQLRVHFRTALEVERTLEMTRKDLRALLRFAKDVFAELGRLRGILNDVQLDPSNASKVLAAEKQRMDETGTIMKKGSTGPGGASTLTSPALPSSEQGNKERGGVGSGWIAPITKLFGTPLAGEPTGDGPGTLRESPTLSALAGLSGINAGTLKRRPTTPRAVPKLAAAVSSSATTVNVEFASSRSRRAVSSTVVASSDSDGPSGGTLGASASASGRNPRRNDLLGIFAGAPVRPPPVSNGESWVVLPRDPSSRKLRNAASSALLNASASSSSSAAAEYRARRGRHRLSRNVDAIVDTIGQRHSIIGEEDENVNAIDSMEDQQQQDGDGSNQQPDFQQTLLERSARTLRSRGLSDSSIRSTFLAAGGEDGSGMPVNRLLTPASLALSSTDTTSTSAFGIGSSFGAFDRQSVLTSLSKKVQSFANYYAPAAGTASSMLPFGAGMLVPSQPPTDDDETSASVSASETPQSSTTPPSSLPTGTSPTASSPPRPIPSSMSRSAHQHARSHSGSVSFASPTSFGSPSRPRSSRGAGGAAGLGMSPSSSRAGTSMMSSILSAVTPHTDMDGADGLAHSHPHPPRRAQEDWARSNQF